MTGSSNMNDWNFSDNYWELMGLISSAFRGRNRRNEEETALLIASLFYLRKEESLWVAKEGNVNVGKDYVIINTGHEQYYPQLNGHCLCCEKLVIEKIASKDFCDLLVSTLQTFRDASEFDYIFIFVDALNKQVFQDGELLALLDRYLKDLDSMKASGFCHPKELSLIVSRLIDENAKCVFDPFGGVMDFATTMPDKQFIACEINETTRNLALFRLALAGVLDKTTLYEKSAEYWTEEKYDAIVTFPPFGYRMDVRDTLLGIQTDADQAVLSHFEQTTNDNGQLIIVVPLSTLFRESSRWCRETITKNNWLDSVVVLPANLYSSTQVASAIIVLKKKREKGEAIRFVDASGCVHKEGLRNIINVDDVMNLISKPDGVHSIEVTADEVMSQDALWLVGWYSYLRLSQKYQEEGPVVSFKDVFVQVAATHQYKESTGYLVTNEKLTSSSIIHYEYKPEEFEITDDLRNARRIAEPVLLTSYGVAFFPVYCNASEDNPIFIKTPTIGTYKITRNDIHVGYLCAELFRRFAELGMFLSGVSNKKLFEMVRLSVPSKAEQMGVYEGMRRTAQERTIKELDLQNTIDDLIAESKKDIRTRKHALMQNTVSLAADWDDLKSYMLTNNGKFDESDIIGFLNPISVGELIKSISENIMIIENKVKHFTDDDWDWGNIDEIDLQDFIQKYIDSHKTTRFGFSFIPRKMEEVFGIDQNGEFCYLVKADWKVLMPQRALLQVFENIVSNARDHGFVDEQNKKYYIKFDFSYTENSVILYIANNGKPLDEGVDTQFVITNGSSTKLNEKVDEAREVHSGFGGYETNSILKKYNATMEVISEPASLYPVTYQIIFKDIKDNFVKGKLF